MFFIFSPCGALHKSRLVINDQFVNVEGSVVLFFIKNKGSRLKKYFFKILYGTMVLEFKIDPTGVNDVSKD